MYCAVCPSTDGQSDGWVDRYLCEPSWDHRRHLFHQWTFHAALGHVGGVGMFSASVACTSPLSPSNAATIMRTEAEGALAHYQYCTWPIVEEEETQQQPTTTAGADSSEICQVCVLPHLTLHGHHSCAQRPLLFTGTAPEWGQGPHDIHYVPWPPIPMHTLHTTAQNCNLAGYVRLHYQIVQEAREQPMGGTWSYSCWH